MYGLPLLPRSSQDRLGLCLIFIAAVSAALGLPSAAPAADPPPPIGGQNTFDGKCVITTGQIVFNAAPRTQLFPRYMVSFSGSGQCSGMLNGRQVTNSEVVLSLAEDEADECVLKTNSGGKGVLAFTNGTINSSADDTEFGLRYRVKGMGVTDPAVLSLEGDQSGAAAGTMRFPDGFSCGRNRPMTAEFTTAGSLESGNTDAEEAPTVCASEPLYDVYWLDGAFGGLTLTETERLCEPYDPELGRNEYVSFIYGDCTVDDSEDDHPGGCLAPLEIQSAPLCERHAGLYSTGLEQGEPYPHESLRIRGVPAASFDDGTVLELYAGETTIAIFGDDAQLVRDAANAVVSAPAYLRPGGPIIHDPTSDLPTPLQSVLDSTEECTA